MRFCPRYTSLSRTDSLRRKTPRSYGRRPSRSRLKMRHARFWLFLSIVNTVSMAQPPQALSLAKAREIALRNHPRIQSAGLIAEAANALVTQARAPYYPMLAGTFTAAGAPSGTTLAAGALTTSSLFSRVGSGIGVAQMVTDFGRTGSLAGTGRLMAAAQGR